MTNNQRPTTNNGLRKESTNSVVGCGLFVAGCRSGFTLVELLLVVGIVAVVATAGIVSLSGKRNAESLTRTVDEVAAVIDATRQRSVTQESASQWGIRFTGATSTSPQSYTVWSGASFALGTLDRLYSLGRGAVFTEPAGISTYELVFSPRSGSVSSTKVLSLAFPGKESFVGDIVVGASGRISTAIMEGLVGYWHFDESSGASTADASGNGNLGTLAGSPAWVVGSACRAGSCLTFDGTNDNLTFPNILHRQFTKSAWIKPNLSSCNASTETRCTIVAPYFETQGLSNLTFYSYQLNPSGWHTANGALVSNVWQHVAVTYDGASVRLYVNGAERYAASSTPNGTPYSYGIGQFGSNVRAMYGSVDEVRIFNQALSAAEIMAQYQQLR